MAEYPCIRWIVPVVGVVESSEGLGQRGCVCACVLFGGGLGGGVCGGCGWTDERWCIPYWVNSAVVFEVLCTLTHDGGTTVLDCYRQVEVGRLVVRIEGAGRRKANPKIERIATGGGSFCPNKADPFCAHMRATLKPL